ncbi:MAG: hypothetical protein ABR923_08730 [Terracidiphilus sp.]
MRIVELHPFHGYPRIDYGASLSTLICDDSPDTTAGKQEVTLKKNIFEWKTPNCSARVAGIQSGVHVGGLRGLFAGSVLPWFSILDPAPVMDRCLAPASPASVVFRDAEFRIAGEQHLQKSSGGLHSSNCPDQHDPQDRLPGKSTIKARW